MKKISIVWLVLAAVCLILSASTVYADSEYGSIDVAPAVVITEPVTGATVSSPVKVC
ncbi:MAG: hypothetical protein HN465_00195, partial [Nitrospina sp.]|nr:hypothetical protein [Nitrospina sp.]